MQNIVLIGFMGVGKGSVAREIIKQSDYIAVDTDDIIESMENRKVKAIFEAEGEPYFRGVEKKVARWLAQSVQNTLISTGGGFYKVPNIKDVGTVVLLHASFDTIYKRIINHPNAKKKIKKRPLLNDKAKARELYDAREPEYMKVADIVVDVSKKTVSEIAEEILKKVAQ
jgi:shikimate kinase